MHEFSIAVSIIESVEKEAASNNASSVTEITLDIGTMSGVEYYALDTALEMAKKGTIIDKANIIVNKIQAKAVCLECGNNFEISSITDNCTKCGNLFSNIISGKELKIKSIVIEDNC